jgi:hypothetical protein
MQSLPRESKGMQKQTGQSRAIQELAEMHRINPGIYRNMQGE